ncbi:hypothetical protein BK659_20320 [Pseudomonas brassicacearum]|uniref:Ester cyclase n=1 Tax=Pseudomonas brassicacearum TaxID=930166 RepID=A0A423H343_9PSED|nr:ester cyclase [Pseudomonas brassicacearum]RON06638.1 hypothetical protein BK659_20320 [Pseudomonas brassicacearum]
MSQSSIRKNYINALRNLDYDLLKTAYAPDAIRKAPGEPDCIGVEQIVSHYKNWQTTFSQTQIADQLLFFKGSMIIAVWAWKAIHTQEFMGVPPSGKEVGLIAASLIWTNDEGKIIKEHTYADPYTLLIQLGVISDDGRDVPDLDKPCQTYYESIAPDYKNLEKMRHYNELLLTKQLEPWLECMSDDIEWDDQMVPGLAVGKQHSKEDFLMLAEAFPDASINMTNLWSVGDFVIHQGIFTATHKGPLKGIPASNRVVNVDNLDIAYFENNKIRKGWTFGNTLDMGSQMGMGQ